MSSLFGKECHWARLLIVIMIFTVSTSTINCNTMWWPPRESKSGVINMALFLGKFPFCNPGRQWIKMMTIYCLGLASLTIYHFVCSIRICPGYVPLGWTPPIEIKNAKLKENLQWCHPCQGYKAPRAHHCKKCGRCVLKMDHHCPFISNCVGYYNLGNYTALLVTSTIYICY